MGINNYNSNKLTESLDGVQMTGVGGVVVEDQVVLLRHVCYSWPKVRLEVI